MKTKKTLGLFAIALTALASVLPGTAKADGDVRSIEFYPEPEGGEVGVVRDLSRPLVAGDKVKFKIRLANRQWSETDADHSYLNPWMLRSLAGAGSVSNRLPQIGLRVSGGLRYADILSWDMPEGDLHHTDLICQYTVQAGDFALPLKLSNSRGTAAAMEGDPAEPSVTPDKSNYYLSNANLWGFFPKNPTDNASTNRLEFYFGPEHLDPSDYPGADAYRTQEVRDYDLSGANIQIKAIDFDDTYVSNGVWRAVAAGTTTATPAAPRLSVPGGASGTYKYYVWTKDSSVAEVENGTEYTFMDGSVHKVATVTVNAGEELTPFTIRAKAGQVGNSTEVYMSDTPTNIYKRAGLTALITNFTTRVITVVQPPPPGIKVVLEPVSGIVSTSTNNYLSVASLDVELSEPWTEDVTVLLTPSMKSGSGADPFDFIGMSTAMSGTEYYDGQLKTLVVKAKKTKASESGGTMIYVYANRANEDTAKGIRFTPTIDPASANKAAAEAFFTGEKTAATLQVNASKPVITAPVEGQEYFNIPANTLTDFTISVADAMWDLHGKTAEDGKYTVYIDYNGSGTYEAIPDLTANASGEITFQYRYIVGGRDYNSKIYVVNQDGISSGKENARAFTVHVNVAKKVEVTPDHAKKTYCEGETAELSFKFTEAFDYATDGFVFLEPADDNSRNMVECDAFEYGIPISVGSTEPAMSAYLTLKDGWKNCAFKYNVVVRSTDDPTVNDNIISVWGSDGITLYSTNAVPSILSVSMNNTPAYASGETLTAKAAVGVQNMFEVSAWDESYDVDLEHANFKTVVKFWENGAVASMVTLNGNPYGQQIPYTFSTGGDGVKNKVTVHVYDKDMTAAERLVVDKNPFTVFVETADAPAISLSPYNSSTYFLESDTGNTKGRIYVDLTVPPTGLGTGHITVHLDVERVGTDDGNYALPVLSSYDLEFKNNITRQSFFLAELDGTPMGASKGYRIRASVVETSQSPDATKTWAEYYAPCTDFIIFVENEDPVIGPGVASTNEIPVAINVPYAITWLAKDIEIDQEKLDVTWTYNGTSETTTEDMRNRTATKEISFSSSGSKTVNLMVKDKDGGFDTREYKFYVAPSKSVEIYPRRPATGSTSAFSSKYTGAAGIGEGRVWAGGASAPTEITGFRHTWSYAPEQTDLSVYAHGYRVGDEDNGSLTPAKDIALAADGTLATPSTTSFYTYTGNNGRDSFFYCWLLNASESGKYEGTHLSTPTPEVFATDVGEGKVVLPEYDESAVSYVSTVLEAIFSHEYLKGDKLGDINQDGIPDVYAAATPWQGGFLYEAAGGTLEEAGDLRNLGQWNGDVVSTGATSEEMGDYLPSKTAVGGTLIPGVVNWTTAGGAFTAFTEVRGFDQHLNYRKDNNGLNRNVRGAWVSVPCFSEAESNAIARVAGIDLTDEAAFAAYLAQPDSWIPENRCDPTVDDTDGDGFPDGYEYFFWYSAMVGEMKDGAAVRMTGSRFRLDNIGQGEVITADEIGKLFDPTSRSGDEAQTRDSDNDGLTDLEELALGTNPVNWDTDGDGMSDYWEVMNGLNPLIATKDDGPEMNLDGDFMARFDTEANYAIVELDLAGDGSKVMLCAMPNNGAGLIDDSDPANLKLADGVEKLRGIEVFHYGDDTAVCVPKNRGGDLKPLEPADIELEDPSTVAVKSFVKDQPLAIIHDQVYAQFGFDPRTGWNKNKNGYVAARWEKSAKGASTEGDSGLAVNTVPYTALDEYLILKYRYETKVAGFDLAADKGRWSARKFGEVFDEGTTKPNAAGWSFTLGEQEWTDDVHGADTDKDGVPDGWELYVNHNPNNSKSEDTADQDSDKLALAAEYAGTDSCNAYEAVETIYANHPGVNKGWYNKFFPTDPAEKDTDGDGIDDGEEGSTWEDLVRYGSAAQGSATYTFIYGEPTDDGSRCIRGGGMNPCTVDTDGDLLPDPWEKEFAGRVNGAGLSASALESALRSDGISSLTNATAPYITAGMDATWAQDAYTGAEKDPRTGTVRDYDFDHDGLQNFQEYLVQTLRHIRYDDCETPLMGSWMPDGTPASRKFVAFTKMNYMDGETFYARVKELGFNATGAWNFRDLGYFAPPPRAWDRVALNTATEGLVNYDERGYRIMLPPKGLLPDGSRAESNGYCCTDPRQWDTDTDGMDDFYEIFHGLNPLLGSVTDGSQNGSLAYDVIAYKYQGKIVHWMNGWTGWPMMPPTDTMFDAMLYPWMNGTPEFDADGDGLRNVDEAVFVNQTSPTTRHTDPTPLWYTDSTSINGASYVSQYYGWDPDAMSADFGCYPWGWAFGSNQTLEGATVGYSFSFEENEGYDTDHDGRSDAEECTTTATLASDALNFADPDRRQAIWFPGENSAAVSARAGTFNRAVYGSGDLLRQFTVEAWFRPEDLTRRQVILERSCVYGASTMTNDTSKIRANFRIGLTPEGKVFGQFDTSDAVDSGTGIGSPMVVGPKVTVDEWTHVALSYDGKALRIFVNGVERNSVPTSLIPANGIYMIAQEANQNAHLDLLNGYTTLDAAVVLGATALDRKAIVISKDSTWASYGEFFKGSLDEVRVWDGVRSSAEIRANYRTRLSVADVKALREEIYQAVQMGATRNDNDGAEMLPAELVLHYNFQALPGAVEAGDVMKEVSGFTKNVLDQVRIEGEEIPGDLYCGWWKQTPVHSTVYSNYRWVPWIQNTCGHLPFMDGSLVDSHYWSERFGGMYAASETANGEDTFTFPNTMNPYPYYNYMSERSYHQLRLENLKKLSVRGAAEADARWNFELRTSLVGSSDLVPLGGAFAKRGTEFWDGFGPEDSWASTGKDIDGDGIPDWWEAIAKASYGAADDFDWNTVVDYNGVQIPARLAYLLDLAKGMLPNGSLNEDYASHVDANANGFVDWWEKLYGITPTAGSDSDNDGLTDYAEYLIYREGVLGEGVLLDPTKAYTDGETFDYFRMVDTADGRQYLGELFTDHDFMDDEWESLYDVSYINPNVWDALGDADGDGWSNWSEARALTDPTLEKSLSLVSAATSEDHALEAYPVPTIRTKIVYNGSSDSFNGPIVVKAWKDKKLSSIPDAKWTVKGSKDTSVSCSRFFGKNPNRVIRFNAGPGMIAEQSVSLDFFDPKYYTVPSSGPIVYHNIDSSKWFSGQVYNRVMPYCWDDPTEHPDGLYSAAFAYGYVNYRTGDVQFDLTRFQDDDYQIREGEQVHHLDLRRAFVRISWKSRVVNTGTSKEMHLALPDIEAGSRGFLKEGYNTFMAFADANGDGEWNPGEPFGVVRNVEVGWDSVTDLTIELTDDHANARFTVAEDGSQVVRILRTQINGKSVSKRTVFTGKYDLNVRAWFTEADFVKGDEYDLDWKNLVDDAHGQLRLAPAAIESATYEVYVGSSETPSTTFTREFTATRSVTVAQSPSKTSDYLLKCCRPTFVWTGDENNTAYLIQIARDEAFTDIVWESGTNSLASGRTYKAPVYVGEQLEDGVRYFWRVAEFNAQFKTVGENDWSAVAEFKTDVDSCDLDTGYGKLAVDVRYYGAATNDASSVVVGVYETADFTGVPVAMKHLGSGSINTLAVVKQDWATVATNICFDGVAPRSYYVMAFIDANGNGKRDYYESWGYLNKIATGASDRNTPVTLNVDARTATVESGLLVIEDTDANQNEVPDCVEDASIWSAQGSDDPHGPVVTVGDVDGDGLQVSEEEELGTDSVKWDTDGDGMPDGWEVWAGTDPLYLDADKAVDGDVMAYAETNMLAVCFWDGTNVSSRTAWYLVDDAAVKTVIVGTRAADLAGTNLRATYDYGSVLGYGSNVVVSAGQVYEAKTVKVALVHAQVYAAFGYDPLTANYTATTVDGTNSVYGVNTKAFTNYDKYLLVRYFEQLGLADEVAVNSNRTWSACTLKVGDADSDRDGLPDGWELYVMFGPNGVTAPDAAAVSPFNGADGLSVAPDGTGMTLVEEYNQGDYPCDPWQSNTYIVDVSDVDVIGFHLWPAENQLADDDGDGLSNWAEYLASRLGIGTFKVNDPCSVQANVLDYFVKTPDGWYVGEALDANGLGLIADHDFMEDDVEDAHGLNRYAFDPANDADGDGWSNFAEVRAGTDPARKATIGIDGFQLMEYPVPEVSVSLTASSDLDANGVVTVVAYDANMQQEAVWANTQSVEQEAADGDAEKDEVIVPSVYLGTWQNRPITRTLGAIEPGSLKVLFKDLLWERVVRWDGVNRGDPTLGDSSAAMWLEVISDVANNEDPRTGKLYMRASREEVGSIEYETGLITLDFTKITESIEVSMGDGTFTGSEHWRETFQRISPMNSYVGVSFRSAASVASVPGVFRLMNPQSGCLKEGLHTFVAFVDANQDGVYTAGEAFGCARNVDVGWNRVTGLNIELSADTAVFPRFDSGVAESTELVRIVRTSINGVDVTPRTVWTRRVDAGTSRQFTEVDFVREGEWDMDWKNLEGQAAELAGISLEKLDSVGYTVYRGGTNELFTFMKRFSVARENPQLLSPTVFKDGVLSSAQPTFAWKCADQGYTAFALQVAKDEAFADVVYATTNLMPAVSAEGDYVFKPALYVGEALEDGTNYFWRVAALNAKFRSLDEASDWSEAGTFRTAVDSTQADTGCGRVAAEVRYYGPSDSSVGDVVVGVYATQDFTGLPVARKHLGGEGTVQTLTGDPSNPFTTVVANVEFDGIAPGSYYLMAFIDVNGNGVRDRYESWGYVNKVGTGAKDIWTPVALEVALHKMTPDSAILVMEDTDVNQDRVPDCLQEFRDLEQSSEFDDLDSDGDGISDKEEESSYGTDPQSSDTDGDGMPDGWELLYGGTDPYVQDGDYAVAGDMMAYVETNLTVIAVGMSRETATNLYLVADHKAAVRTGALDAGLASKLHHVYSYGSVYGWGAPAIASEFPAGAEVYSIYPNTKVALVHAQVYAAFGFDKTTATGADGAVNTKPFTALDKYLLARYLEQYGLADEAAANAAKSWSDCTLKPGLVDGDNDGMADGWELYVMFGPSAAVTGDLISPFDATDAGADADGDGLANADEYNGGVACTDPWNRDSDGDEIDDGDARDYGVAGGTYTDDDDGDQLSNFAELLITKGFGFANVSSTNANSAALVPDYFLRQGQLYMGEMFADHDFMEDWWEDLYEEKYVTRAHYDPWADNDADGWSNFAECRACLSRGKVTIVDGIVSNIVSRSFTKGEESSANTFEELMKREGLWIRTDEHSISADSLENLNKMVNKTITYWQTNEVTHQDYEYAQDGGVPTPTINLSVAYAGNVKSEYYVVCAWGRDASVLDLPDARWTVVAASNIAQVVFSDARNYTLGACEAPSALSKGKLREGLNTFVVYAADTVDAAWKPGKPFGVVKNVDVGWSTASVVVNVTDTSAQMARFDLVSAIGADFAGASEATDRGVFGKRGDYLPNVPEVYVGTNMPAKTATTRVRIVRNWINEVAHERYTKLVWDGDVDLTVHPTLTEADLLKDGMLDLDWGTLTNDYLASGARSIYSLGDATYRVVIGDGPMGDFENFGNNLAVQFVNVFETGVTQSMTVADAAMPETIYGARPTFRWTHPNTVGKAYPAFQLKIWRTTDNVNAGALVYDSGALPAPARDENGVYSWTAPICAGMALPDGTVFETTNNYLWAVSMLDAKFTSFNANEKKNVFRLNVSDDFRYGLGHGSIRVAVKYFGPGKTSVKPADKARIIRVQAFKTPDFAGEPAGEAFVTNVATIAATDAIDENAVICGLEAGTYYIRAFIDTDYDCVKSDWESWGYANYVGIDVPEDKTVYTPMAFTLKTSDVTTPVAVVYMEDADTDNDNFPDVWEMDEKGDLETQGPITGDDFWSRVNPDLNPTLSALGRVTALSQFSTASLQMLAAATIPDEKGSVSSEILALVSGDDSVPNPVATIESFSVDAGIMVSVEAGESAEGASLLSVLPAPVAYRFEAVLMTTESLAGEWSALETVEFSVRAGETAKVDTSAFNQAIKEASEKSGSGFFKVKINRK